MTFRWNTFEILPRNGCIWINRIFTSAMEKQIAGKRSMECKQKQLEYNVFNKCHYNYNTTCKKNYLNLVKGR
jgi:hypothetical protein